MPDTWESATGSNPATNDAMTRAADGYALIERYVNWLAVPHATSVAGGAVDVDLAAYTLGFSRVSPRFVVSGPQNGTVALQGDGHTARFQPGSGFHGVVVLVHRHGLGRQRVYERSPGARGALAIVQSSSASIRTSRPPPSPHLPRSRAARRRARLDGPGCPPGESWSRRRGS